MKTTEFEITTENGVGLTGFATLVEAIQYASKAASELQRKLIITQITRQLCKVIDPVVEE